MITSVINACGAIGVSCQKREWLLPLSSCFFADRTTALIAKPAELIKTVQTPLADTLWGV